MKNTFNVSLIASLTLSLIACGGDGGSDITPPSTAMVSFSIADAPVDSAAEVNVSYTSITLERTGEDDIELPIVDDNGDPITINLLDYQNGESLLVLSDTELPVGDYRELIINTFECPQNQNGSTEFCNVVEDSNATLPLKTPSNKLRLGGFTVTTEGTQAYTIDFNLRKSLVSTANGQSYNLKPHGVTIVDNTTVGEISGSIDPNLLSAGDCQADTGNVVYLYNQPIDGFSVLGDEFDPEIDTEVPTDIVAPYSSKMVQQDSETNLYSYSFAHLPAGDYTLAFSCSAVDDDPELYDAIVIADPQDQDVELTVIAGEVTEHNFEEAI
ncbi:hypothetical protein AHAT_04590 [Agarivorans sp. Toyoura001]|uniref:DUF4382 domain-containing protein n=1 Tax=Agarivorans sp. Toyoura001 TaxID=2283141 RepID=UPI0010EA291C|nr:DUF4382 domain-containing protein [Agarivorans sp. Toyoura001]GDY24569.1 hypothetical protein AHAT_04590 [Agarivorans sp. Toyoura001]